MNGLDVRQADEYQKWRNQERARRAEDEDRRRKDEAETNASIQKLPADHQAHHTEHGGSGGLPEKLARAKERREKLEPLCHGFEMERSRLFAERTEAETQAVEEVRREYGERLAEVGKREAAALAEIGE